MDFFSHHYSLTMFDPELSTIGNAIIYIISAYTVLHCIWRVLEFYVTLNWKSSCASI